MTDETGERIVVPAREGRTICLARGERLRIVDVEGGQVADTFAYCDGDASEYLSMEHTRVVVSRLLPRVGEAFVTNLRRPILTFEQDASPGVHDTLLAACDPARYVALGVEGWHASCKENVQRAMGELGYEGVTVPQPVNFFMNTPLLDSEGTIGWRPSPTQAGDYVQLRAELPCIVCVSACPQDQNPINGDAGPTSLALERWPARAPRPAGVLA